MNLAPLTNAPFAIQLHAYAALAAFVLGAVQLARVKGTTQHRALGYTWVALMLIVAISSFWIHALRPWSPIHLLSILTLLMLPLGVYYARRHSVIGHKSTMVTLFAGPWSSPASSPWCLAALCIASCSAAERQTTAPWPL